MRHRNSREARYIYEKVRKQNVQQALNVARQRQREKDARRDRLLKLLEERLEARRQEGNEKNERNEKHEKHDPV